MTLRAMTLSFFVFGAGALAFACSGKGSETRVNAQDLTCQPGDVAQCLCLDGRKGTRACTEKKKLGVCKFEGTTSCAAADDKKDDGTTDDDKKDDDAGSSGTSGGTSGSSGGKPDGGTDASTPPPDTGPPTSACGSITNSAANVIGQNMGVSYIADGGSLAAGHYELVRVWAYKVPSAVGATYKRTLVIDDSKHVLMVSREGGTDVVTNSLWATGGSGVTRMTTLTSCPSGTPTKSYPYIAYSDEVDVFEEIGSGGIWFEYEKR